MALRQNLNLSDVLELLADADSGDDDLDDGGDFQPMYLAGSDSPDF
jgi:hypothetical protein